MQIAHVHIRPEYRDLCMYMKSKHQGASKASIIIYRHGPWFW